MSATRTNGCRGGEDSARAGSRMKRTRAAILTLALIAGCTTLQEIKRPNGDVEYLIACGAGLGWNICYDRANQVCPTGYTTLSEHAGFNRKELRILCPGHVPKSQ